MIGIIDYGMGNIHSIFSASKFVGIKAKICKDISDLKGINKLILPGVGAFYECMEMINKNGMLKEINERVIKKDMPILGICLGMQIMASKSNEFANCDGLNWIDGNVVKMKTNIITHKIPHVGWNTVYFNKDSPIFKNIPKQSDFYFVHSFYFDCKFNENIDAKFMYDKEFVAAVRKKNIFGIQFHPEKSQDLGLNILENFNLF